MSQTTEEWFLGKLDRMKALNSKIEKKLKDNNTTLAGKVQCTVDAIEKALGNDGGGGDGGDGDLLFGHSSYGYGRQRKAMVGYRTPKQRHRRQY